VADLGITLATADARVAMYLKAETDVLSAQAVGFADGREVTRADLKEIRAGIIFWQAQVASLGGVKPRPVGRVRRGSYRSR
jgi:hypothetical protein